MRERRGNPPDWIELFRLTHTDWRVSDSRIDRSEPRRLLGYIERLDDGRYEALWISEPIGWAYLPTMSQAVEAFEDRGRFSEFIDRERETRAPATWAALFHRTRHRSPSHARSM